MIREKIRGEKSAAVNINKITGRCVASNASKNSMVAGKGDKVKKRSCKMTQHASMLLEEGKKLLEQYP